MNILLVYPETPSTFYSFKNALKFISKRSAEPPLGLLTVAALLPALIEWGERNNFPFSFTTEVSIDLVDDEELVDLMVKAGFTNIFERQIRFIQNSGIVTAMVGLLNVPAGTRLLRRMKSENRLLKTTSGDNMDGTLNFIFKMPYRNLVGGYKNILESIYSQKAYYERVKTLLEEYRPRLKRIERVTIGKAVALLKAVWKLGVLERGKRYFWKLFFLSVFKYPRNFALSMTLAVYGFHFRRVVARV